MGGYRWNKKPNIVVYDPMMFVLSNMLASKDILLANKDAINEGIKHLFEESQAMFNGRNTSRANVEERINLFNRFFNSYLG